MWLCILTCLYIFILVRLVPFISHLLLPVHVLFNVVHSFLDNSKRLPNLEVFHVLFIVQLVRKFKQLVDFSLFVVFLLLLSSCPGRLLNVLFWFRSRRSNRLDFNRFNFCLSISISFDLFRCLQLSDLFSLFSCLFFKILGLEFSELFFEHLVLPLLSPLSFEVLQVLPMASQCAVRVL